MEIEEPMACLQLDWIPVVLLVLLLVEDGALELKPQSWLAQQRPHDGPDGAHMALT